MMNVNQIVDYVEERLDTLVDLNDIALDSMLNTDIDDETFKFYKKLFNNTYEKITELRKLLIAIITYESEDESNSE